MEVGSAEVVPPPEPETLEAGPTVGRRHPLALSVGLGIVAVVVAGLLAWQFWPRPVAPLALSELQGIYAGMVRGDGTNDASVLPRPKDTDRHTVTPTDCLPLFDPTEFGRFPAEAIDGVGTYWMGSRIGGSLFSFRFADAAAAARSYDQVAAALTACADREVRFDREVRINEQRSRTARLERTPVNTAGTGVVDQLGYLYTTGNSSRFAIHVLRYENLVSWQFRNADPDGEYFPLEAQQLMDALTAQTRSVIDLRERPDRSPPG